MGFERGSSASRGRTVPLPGRAGGVRARSAGHRADEGLGPGRQRIIHLDAMASGDSHLAAQGDVAGQQRRGGDPLVRASWPGFRSHPGGSSHTGIRPGWRARAGRPLDTARPSDRTSRGSRGRPGASSRRSGRRRAVGLRSARPRRPGRRESGIPRGTGRRSPGASAVAGPPPGHSRRLGLAPIP